MRKIAWLLLMMSCGTCAFADDAEVYLSDEAVQGRYTTGAGLIGLDAGELGAEVFINEADDFSVAADLNFIGQPAGLFSPWTFGAGPKLYATTLDIFDENYAAVAIGASAGYVLPLKIPAQVTGQIYYAPEITTVGDAEDLTDFIVRIESEFIENITGFLGYRLFEAELDDSNDHDLDDDIHIGVRLAF